MMDYYFLEEELKDVLYWHPKANIKKVLIGTLGIFLLLILGTFLFQSSALLFLSRDIASWAYGKVVENQKISLKNQGDILGPLSQDKNKRINILLIGIPGKPWPAPYLTDSIQVISLSPEMEKIVVIAIPRDLLVKIPDSNYKTRINSLYSIENNPSILSGKIKEITGLTTQYYIVIDLKTLEKIIDIMGGVDVNVKEKLYDPAFPTISRGYEVFSLSAGSHHLDGKTAIKYIRSRHQSKGDFGRIERQQQVMEILKRKIIKLNILRDFGKITALFKEFKGKTNFTLKELKILINLAVKKPAREIKYLIIDAGKADSLLIYGETILGNQRASVLWPKKGKFNYAEIKAKINTLLKD